MLFEYEDFAGFSNCATFRHQGLKLIITTVIGPRILYFGREDGPNHLLVREEHCGLLGGEYRSYGGHRLWTGPEERPKTYTSDSYSVEVYEEAEAVRFASRVDEFFVRKLMRVSPIQGGFRIEHQLLNCGAYDVELCPWAITVMDPGGECVIPMHPVRPQSEGLLPVQPVVLWAYAQMDDPRYTWGKRVARLRSTDDPNPTKFGSYVSQGVAAYSNHGETFVKQFDVQPKGSSHIDMGCNFESYTKQGMLEVESLGYLQKVSPSGSTAVHTEKWFLVDGIVPSSDADAGAWFDQLEL
ncbi:MAG: hypothetical protein CBB60_007645 [Armatimonadetes bacterium Cent15-Ar3]|nr:MAG: hypothetical protein CBB60_007645 [Armatimonadetes bacterium Cent15-Ar3]